MKKIVFAKAEDQRLQWEEVENYEPFQKTTEVTQFEVARVPLSNVEIWKVDQLANSSIIEKMTVLFIRSGAAMTPKYFYDDSKRGAYASKYRAVEPDARFTFTDSQ